jgi:hypothetical protein
MKKVFNRLVVLVFVIGFFTACTTNLQVIKGNGNFVTSEKNVSKFEKLNINNSATVRFHVSQEYRVIVTVDENLAEYLEIETRGNSLNIGTKRGSYSFTRFQVDVYCPFISGVTVSGSGNFASMDKITTSTFESSVSGSGKIEGRIECENFSARISGSGGIIVIGNSKNSNISISGSGKFTGTEFAVNNADIRTSGSGSVDIQVSDNLKASVSGSGGINYSGEPKLDTKVSGSGRIRKL